MNAKNTSLHNALSQETSPYLIQHANNPVNWMAWNNESLSLAEHTGKPILLSIGYSACHWCHVMAEESFEDQNTSAIMNKLFINIKVDKEERPDLDKIYQNAHSLLTERPGGWPLTVFLTPDTQMPIFAGTYFPKESRYGLPAFTSLLKQISEIWRTRQDDVQQQSNSLNTAYQRIYKSTKPENIELNHAAIDIARNQIEKQFDNVHGGFSDAPKFLHPSILDFSIKHWCRSKALHQNDPRILHSAVYTLEKMANGGLFDHLGGGFYRYSTDKFWMIPHFEKMLYDNGPLLTLYSQLWKINNEQAFHTTVTETADWVIREMQAPDGGYYSSQDADSEDREGKFFVWSEDEINEQLIICSHNKDIKPLSIDIFKQRFCLNDDSNFEDLWHLHGHTTESQLAKTHKQDKNELHHQLTLIRQQFFQHREKRIHPDTDTKVLCAWNGLMIHGMANAGRLLDINKYTESATAAAHFLKQHCWNNNQLFASTKDGKTTIKAYVDDYAFLIYGLLELLQNKWDDDLYTWALKLADKLLSDFEDTDFGGFYFTSHHHEDLIQRLKIFSDDAIPSGNAIVALTLNRLGYLSGKTQYIKAAESCLRSAIASMTDAPISHCALLSALNEHLNPPNILIVRTTKEDEKKWQSIIQDYYLPFTFVYNIPAEQTPHTTLSDKVAGNTSKAYPCRGQQCQQPIKTEYELRTYLQNNSYRVLE